jgi:hypothetical protein
MELLWCQLLQAAATPTGTEGAVQSTAAAGAPLSWGQMQETQLVAPAPISTVKATAITNMAAVVSAGAAA